MAKQSIITEKNLFTPRSNKKLTRSYRELQERKELKDLTTEMLKFCWYAGCYYIEIEDERERYEMAITAASLKLEPKDHDDFMQGIFPPEIKNAITVFESFEVSARLESKLIAEATLKNYRTLVSTNIKEVGKVVIYDEETGQAIGEKRDWQQVSAYVNATLKINEAIPSLLEAIESSYGVDTSNRTIDTSGVRDDYQQSRKT